MRKPELSLSPRKRLAAVTIVAGVAALEGAALGANVVHAVPSHACISRVKADGQNPPDAHVQAMDRLWPGLGDVVMESGVSSGVLIRTAVPPGAYGVQVTWKDKGEGDKAWHDHLSPMIAPNTAGIAATKKRWPWAAVR